MVSLFSKTLVAGALVGAALGKDVACAVGGVQQSIVDLDTGSCSFNVPSVAKTIWQYTSPEDYTAEFDYVVVQAVRYFTDITSAGRTITVPARFLYGFGEFPVFSVFSEKHSPSNSTGALHKRFAKVPEFEKRDEESDLVAYLKTLDGTELPGSIAFSVVDPAGASSNGGDNDATSTATNTATDIVTITSCSNDICHETTVPAPTVTLEHTTIITITSCSKDLCHETAVPATLGETQATVNGEVTSYTTWCPLQETDKTKYVTVTSCEDNKCHKTVAPVTQGWTTVTNGPEVTSYITWCPATATAQPTAQPTEQTLTTVTEGHGSAPANTVAGQSTTQAQTTAASVSTFEASGSIVCASLLAVLMPLLAMM